MPGIASKSFDKPDETRAPDKTKVEPGTRVLDPQRAGSPDRKRRETCRWCVA
jgi:hypothetical protein